MNYFELFGLIPTFEIDIKTVKQTYLKLQQKFHPDLHNDPKTKIHDIEMSMSINDAYKTLLNDHSRATYLLSTLGYDISEQNVSGIISAQELEEIWEDNEKLESINNLASLYEFENLKLQEQKELIDSLKFAFDHLLKDRAESSKSIDQKLEKVLALTIKLKYLINLIENIRLKIKQLNISSDN